MANVCYVQAFSVYWDVRALEGEEHKAPLVIIILTCNMHKTKRKGLQGAFYLKGRGYWRSSIKINGVQHHLGNFKTEQEAYKTYMSEKQKRSSRF